MAVVYNENNNIYNESLFMKISRHLTAWKLTTRITPIKNSNGA